MLETMQIGALQQHFRSRLRKRTPWVIVLLFAALFTGLQFLVVPMATQLRHPGALVNSLVMPFLVSFSYGFLAPMPWRWSGDDPLPRRFDLDELARPSGAACSRRWSSTPW